MCGVVYCCIKHDAQDSSATAWVRDCLVRALSEGHKQQEFARAADEDCVDVLRIEWTVRRAKEHTQFQVTHAPK